MKRTVITIEAPARLCQRAWDGIWKARAALPEGEQHRDYRCTYCPATRSPWFGRDAFITASDLEAAVKHLIVDELQPPLERTYKYLDWLHGHPWGYIFKVPGYHGLNDAVRRWLLDMTSAGEIKAHNFGRHHISGMRFRPVDEGTLTEQEERTLKDRERRKTVKAPVHFNRGHGKLLCLHPKSGHYYSRWRGRGPRVTEKQNEVTCPRGQNLLKSGWTIINYGINRKDPHRKGQIQLRNACAVIGAKWGAADFQKLVLDLVKRRHAKEGWTLSGYALPTAEYGPHLYMKDSIKAIGTVYGIPGIEDWIIKAAALDNKPSASEQEREDFLYELEVETGIRLHRGDTGWDATIA